jgi:hypothetical protein
MVVAAALGQRTHGEGEKTGKTGPVLGNYGSAKTDVEADKPNGL